MKLRFIHSIMVSLFLFTSIFLWFGVNEAFAGNYLTQINKASSSKNIERLQKVFDELWLYNGKIDWEFSSLESSLIDYQVNAWIIPDKNHSHAGYFWKRTIDSLQKKYWQKYLDLQEKYLKYDTPKQWKEIVFTATAYYSPIRGQKKYYMWNYEAEIRLQWRGTTASGTKPHPWTLALPRGYAFWTKIYLDGIWVWVVEDRWWAIVGNRIDIWMWEWDEGRERAIKFGKRKVKWYIVDSEKDITIEFNSSKISKYSSLRVDAENPNSENVKKLQQLLQETWLYTWKIDGDFESVKDILINFQIENNIIGSKNDAVAWFFGRKTYEALRKQYRKWWLFVEKQWEEESKIEKDISQKSSWDTLSEDDKKAVNIAKNQIVDIFRKKYKNEKQVALAIQDLKHQIHTEIFPVIREKRVKSIMMYLVEIL